MIPSLPCLVLLITEPVMTLPMNEPQVFYPMEPAVHNRNSVVLVYLRSLGEATTAQFAYRTVPVEQSTKDDLS